VYPYSIFHIFFEQYLNTHKDAATLVGLPLLAVFITAWIFTGGWWVGGGNTNLMNLI
jgi:Niemann-Pick C1 protein